MKYKRLIVAIENKRGTFYQVALDQMQMDMVASLLEQIHEGSIKVMRPKLPLKLDKNKS